MKVSACGPSVRVGTVAGARVVRCPSFDCRRATKYNTGRGSSSSSLSTGAASGLESRIGAERSFPGFPGCRTVRRTRRTAASSAAALLCFDLPPRRRRCVSVAETRRPRPIYPISSLQMRLCDVCGVQARLDVVKMDSIRLRAVRRARLPNLAFCLFCVVVSLGLAYTGACVFLVC